MTDSPDTQELLPIEQYFKYAEQTASYFYRTSGYKHKYEYCDLLQEARMALVAAYSRFSSDKKASFKTYAFRRMRGAMLDFIRTITNSANSYTIERNKRISEYIEEQNKLGNTTPSVDEISKALKITRQSVREVLSNEKFQLFEFSAIKANSIGDDQSFSIEDIIPDSVDHIQAQEYKLDIETLLAGLSSEERTIITSFYYQEIPDAELAKTLCLSVPNLRYKRLRAINKLRILAGIHEQTSDKTE